jgi:hypothetical protein
LPIESGAAFGEDPPDRLATLVREAIADLVPVEVDAPA